MADLIPIIFKNKKIDFTKLCAYGFEKVERKALSTIDFESAKADMGYKHEICYLYTKTLRETDFILTVEISFSGDIAAKITDSVTGEPYTLHLVDGAVGGFVGSIKSQYQEILTDISEKCFVPDVFQTDIAKRLIAHVREAYGDEPEFLWKKFDGNAVLRCRHNQKWYGILLTVSKEKLGIPSNETAEIIDLRLAPEELEQLIDHKHYYPGYHMNKKHWYTMLLDGSVSFEEICQRIQASYLLTSKQRPSAH